jgi:hypothetical protein
LRYRVSYDGRLEILNLHSWRVSRPIKEMIGRALKRLARGCIETLRLRIL